MAIAREAEPVGSLKEVKEAGLDREDLLGIYRNMLLTRGIEERGHILYRQGKIPGSFYTGRGRSEEHTSELQSRGHLVCRLLLEKKKPTQHNSARATLKHKTR